MHKTKDSLALYCEILTYKNKQRTNSKNYSLSSAVPRAPRKPFPHHAQCPANTTLLTTQSYRRLLEIVNFVFSLKWWTCLFSFWFSCLFVHFNYQYHLCEKIYVKIEIKRKTFLKWKQACDINPHSADCMLGLTGRGNCFIFFWICFFCFCFIAMCNYLQYSIY